MTIYIKVNNELYHYGMPRRSGRYPWGSGDRPYQGDEGYISTHRKKAAEKKKAKQEQKVKKKEERLYEKIYKDDEKYSSKFKNSKEGSRLYSRFSDSYVETLNADNKITDRNNKEEIANLKKLVDRTNAYWDEYREAGSKYVTDILNSKYGEETIKKYIARDKG